MADTWKNADPYEAYVGRWSRLLAPAFVAWADVPQGARLLDVGCGTGALSEALLARAPASLVGIDLSQGFVEEARRRLGGPHARFEVASATALPLADGSVDGAFSALVLNFIPEPADMVRELRRVLVPGGRVGLYVWDYAEGMEMMRHFWDAAVELDPEARALDEAVRSPICAPEALERLFRSEGFEAVTTRALDQPMRFESFDAFWAPFLGGQGPAPVYLASRDAKMREALRENVRARLPIRPDGAVALVARAWAVKARAPT